MNKEHMNRAIQDGAIPAHTGRFTFIVFFGKAIFMMPYVVKLYCMYTNHHEHAVGVKR